MTTVADREIDFCFCGDKIYVERYLPVLVKSLEIHNHVPGYCPNYHIICSSNFDEGRFDFVSGSGPGRVIKYIVQNIASNFFKKSEIYSYISDESLLRLLIFDLIPDRKIVYLDIDTLCVANITELFDIEHDFCAVPDPWSKRWMPELGGWITRDNSFDRFNAGVLVLDLHNLHGYTKRCLTVFEEMKSQLQSGDQQVLGIVRPDYYPLHAKYNFCTSFLDWCIQKGRDDAYQSYIQYGYNAKIIHFTQQKKPWNSSVMFSDQWEHIEKQMTMER